MGNTIVRSVVVVAAIGVGAIGVYYGLTVALSEEGTSDTGPSHEERLDRIFSEPGTPPGGSTSSR